MGGAFDWSVPIIAALALGCLLLVLASHDLRDIKAPPLLLAGAAVTLWTGLQLLPLGTTLASALVPDRESAQRLLGTALGYLPATATAITFDHAATRLELLKGCALLCAFGACYVVAIRGRGRMLLAAIAGSGALMALVALVHRAADAQSVYGLYQWQIANPRLPAPILNDNCLAGFLVLTAPVALGLAMSTPDARVRLVQYLSAFVIAGTGLLTGSRAGTGAMVFALVSMLIASRLRVREQGPRLGLAALPVASAIAIGVVVGAEPIFRALSSDDFSKIDLVRDGFRLALDHPWFGVGRGGFSAAMTASMDDGGRFVHAENFLSTWCSEWGFPLAALLVAAVAHAAFCLVMARSPSVLGAGVGLVAFGAQNLLDLGSELLGIAAVAMALLGTALGEAFPYGALPGDAAHVRVRVIGWVVAGATTLSLLWITPHAFADGDDAFAERLARTRAEGARSSFRGELERALAAHPFEPVLYLTAAGEGVDHRDPHALRWLNLTMLRAPRWSQPHAEATRLLIALGRPHQAALEAREAAGLRPGTGAAAVCAVVRSAPRLDYVLLAAEGPREPAQKRAYFESVARCLANTQVGRSLDQHLAQGSLGGPGPALREHRRLLAEGRAQDATALLARAATMAGAEPGLILAFAADLLRAGKLDEATAQLRRVSGGGEHDGARLRLSAEIAAARGDASAMRSAIEKLRALGAGAGPKLAEAALLRARLETGLGNFKEAEAALDDAVALDPSPTTLRAALSRARALGTSVKIARIRMSLCAIAPAAPECR